MRHEDSRVVDISWLKPTFSKEFLNRPLERRTISHLIATLSAIRYLPQEDQQTLLHFGKTISELASTTRQNNTIFYQQHEQILITREELLFNAPVQKQEAIQAITTAAEQLFPEFILKNPVTP